jgi:hypothetical protein
MTAWGLGTGSEVMQRIGVPMIGGMVSSTLLTLIVISAIYGLVKGWNLPHWSSVGRWKQQPRRNDIVSVCPLGSVLRRAAPITKPS